MMWKTKARNYYTGGTANYGVTDTSILQALIKGFAAIGEGLATIFTFGQSIEIDIDETLDRTDVDAMRGDWEAVGDDMRNVMGIEVGTDQQLPPLRKDRYRLKNTKNKEK